MKRIHLTRAAGLVLALGVGCGVSSAQESPGAKPAADDPAAAQPAPLQETPAASPDDAAKSDGEPQGRRPIDEETVRALAEEIARLRAEIAILRSGAAPAGAGAGEPFTPLTDAEKAAAGPSVGTRTEGPGEVIVIHGDPPVQEVVEREVIVEREVPVYVDREVIVETAPTVYYEQVVYRDVSCWQHVSWGHSHYAGCGHHYYGCACHPWYYDLTPGFGLQFVYVHDDDDDDHHHHGRRRDRDRDWDRYRDGDRDGRDYGRPIASREGRAPGAAEPIRSLPGSEPRAPVTSGGSEPVRTGDVARPVGDAIARTDRTTSGTKTGRPSVPVIVGDPSRGRTTPARGPGRTTTTTPTDRTTAGREGVSRVGRTPPTVRTTPSAPVRREAPSVRRHDAPTRTAPAPQRAPQVRQPAPARAPQARPAPSHTPSRAPAAPRRSSPGPQRQQSRTLSGS